MRFLIVVVSVTLVLGAAWMIGPGADRLPLPVLAPPSVAAAIAMQGRGAPPAQWLAAVPGGQGRADPVPAWTSMAEARAHGDPRSPPLQRSAAADPAPGAAQLADPVAYHAYEQSQHARALAAFAVAADDELPRLRADVARARAAGIAPADIVKVEQKIRRLEQLRNAIVEQGAVPVD